MGEFRTDLYAGAADAYERFRPPYPADLVHDLVERVAPTGAGRLLDLACGTGQLAFALRPWFAEVWAVDQEPDMVRVVSSKAGSDPRIRPMVARAENLAADPNEFELVTIGTAFHRLRRPEVAQHVARWLVPRGHLALCWSGVASEGTAEWQQALAASLERWSTELGTADCVPPGWDASRRETSDVDVLAAAGFEIVGRFDFPHDYAWRVANLIGLFYSTSVLPRSALGDRVADFEAEVAEALAPYLDGGVVTSTMRFAYDLARLPTR